MSLTMVLSACLLRMWAWLVIWALMIPLSSTSATDIHEGFAEAKTGRFENFEYRVRLLLTDGGGLIGICLELVNKSEKKPLLMRRPAMNPSIGISLYDSEGNDMVDHIAKQQKISAETIPPNRTGGSVIKWKMKPLGFERYFISLRELLGSPPKAERNEGCMLYVYPLAVSVSVPPSIEGLLPPEMFHDVIITQKALEMDATKAYKRALIQLKDTAGKK